MTMNKFLGGVALAALLAGAAQAQTITVDGGSTVLPGGHVFASEVDLSVDGQTGDLIVNMDFSGGSQLTTLGGADQVDFTVDLTGFEFTRVITSGDAVDIGADANCNFNIQADGAQGATTVTFRSSGAINACTGNNIEVTLPIEVTANNANFAWETTLVGPGTSLNSDTYDADGGTAGDQPLITQAQEFSVAIAAGAAPADLDGPDFVQFLGATFDIFGSVAVVAAGAGDADLAGTALGIDDVVTANNTLTITLADITGIASITVDVDGSGTVNAGDTSCVPSGTTCVIDLDAADLAAAEAAALNIIVTSEDDALAPIAAQDLSATAALEAGVGFDVSGITGLTGDLDPIARDDGLDNGTFANSNFAWVRFGAGGTESNFRIQFASEDEANAVTELGVNVADGNGVTAGQVALTAGTADTGFVVQGSTITFNSRALGDVSGDSGNADITDIDVVFDETEAGTDGGTVLRQLVNRAPGSFVATPGLVSDN